MSLSPGQKLAQYEMNEGRWLKPRTEGREDVDGNENKDRDEQNGDRDGKRDNPYSKRRKAFWQWVLGLYFTRVCLAFGRRVLSFLRRFFLSWATYVPGLALGLYLFYRAPDRYGQAGAVIAFLVLAWWLSTSWNPADPRIFLVTRARHVPTLPRLPRKNRDMMPSCSLLHPLRDLPHELPGASR